MHFCTARLLVTLAYNALVDAGFPGSNSQSSFFVHANKCLANSLGASHCSQCSFFLPAEGETASVCILSPAVCIPGRDASGGFAMLYYRPSPGCSGGWLTLSCRFHGTKRRCCECHRLPLVLWIGAGILWGSVFGDLGNFFRCRRLRISFFFLSRLFFKVVFGTPAQPFTPYSDWWGTPSNV